MSVRTLILCCHVWNRAHLYHLSTNYVQHILLNERRALHLLISRCRTVCHWPRTHPEFIFWQLLKWIVWELIVKRKFWVYPKVKGFDRTNMTPVTYACMLLLPWCDIASVAIFFVSGTLASLWKQPFLLAPCHWDILQEGTSATQWQKFHNDDIKSVLNSVRSADWTT